MKRHFRKIFGRKKKETDPKSSQRGNSSDEGAAVAIRSEATQVTTGSISERVPSDSIGSAADNGIEAVPQSLLDPPTPTYSKRSESDPTASSCSPTVASQPSSSAMSDPSSTKPAGAGAPVLRKGALREDAPHVTKSYNAIPFMEQTKLPRGGVSVETKAVGRVQVNIIYYWAFIFWVYLCLCEFCLNIPLRLISLRFPNFSRKSFCSSGYRQRQSRTA